jgi:hypothetical protein
MHMLGWKVGTSRGTVCGLVHDSPAMLSLQGKPTEGVSPYPEWSCTTDSARVTCDQCRAKLAAETEQHVTGRTP